MRVFWGDSPSHRDAVRIVIGRFDCRSRDT